MIILEEVILNIGNKIFYAKKIKVSKYTAIIIAAIVFIAIIIKQWMEW